MSSTDQGWRDEDFHAPAPEPDPSLVDLSQLIRNHLQSNGSTLELLDEIRLFIMARFYQVPPETIATQLAGWGMDPEYASELVTSALRTSRYDKRVELARRMAEADRTGPEIDPMLEALTRNEPSFQSDPFASPFPLSCPTCNRALYPVASLRPAPALGWPARFLILGGSLFSAILYLLGLAYLRSEFPVKTRTLAFTWFPIAIVPALVLGILAYRLPRVVRLACHGCGWKEIIHLPRYRNPRPAATGGETSQGSRS